MWRRTRTSVRNRAHTRAPRAPEGTAGTDGTPCMRVRWRRCVWSQRRVPPRKYSRGGCAPTALLRPSPLVCFPSCRGECPPAHSLGPGRHDGRHRATVCRPPLCCRLFSEGCTTALSTDIAGMADESVTFQPVASPRYARPNRIDSMTGDVLVGTCMHTTTFGMSGTSSLTGS